MVDIAPTILDLAEVEVPESMDGRSFKNQLFKKASRKVKSRNLFIEYSGEANPKTIDAGCQFGDSRNLSECFIGNWCKCQDARNNTYNCLLHFKGKVKFKYCEFDDDLVSMTAAIFTPDCSFWISTNSNFDRLKCSNFNLLY